MSLCHVCSVLFFPVTLQTRRSSPSPTPSSTKAATRADVIPPDRVCAFTSAGFNSAVDEILSPPTGVAVLPASARIADSFLTTLIRLCRLEEVPLLVLARVGYRATGNRADVDGTDEVRKQGKERSVGMRARGVMLWSVKLRVNLYAWADTVDAASLVITTTHEISIFFFLPSLRRMSLVHLLLGVFGVLHPHPYN